MGLAIGSTIGLAAAALPRGRGAESPAAVENKPTPKQSSATLPPETYTFSISIVPRNPDTQEISPDLYTGYRIVENFAFQPLAAYLNLPESTLGRITNLAFFVAPFSLWISDANHEVGGHFAQFGRKGHPPFPELRFWKNEYNLSKSEKEDFFDSPLTPLNDYVEGSAAGTAASQFLSVLISRKITREGATYLDAMLYLMEKLEFSGYALISTNRYHILPGYKSNPNGDIDLYLQAMSAQTTGRLFKESNGDNPGFSNWVIPAAAGWDLADPTLIFMEYILYQYVANGKERFKIPNFLPRTNVALTVNGPQFYLALPFKTGEIAFDPYIRTTMNNQLDESYGLGLDVAGIPLSRRLKLDFGLHYGWDDHGKLEGAADVYFKRLMFNNNFGTTWFGPKIGLKTEGQQLGQPYEENKFLLFNLEYTPR